MESYFMVEIVVRKNSEVVQSLNWLHDIIGNYIVLESSEKVIADVPPDCHLFKSDFMGDLFHKFNDSLYIALAYLTAGEELILDFEGKAVDYFDTTVDGKMIKKYVKKRLVVVEENETTLQVKGYVLNHKFINPIVKVLDVYSIKYESGVALKNILGEA